MCIHRTTNCAQPSVHFHQIFHQVFYPLHSNLNPWIPLLDKHKPGNQHHFRGFPWQSRRKPEKFTVHRTIKSLLRLKEIRNAICTDFSAPSFQRQRFLIKKKQQGIPLKCKHSQQQQQTLASSFITNRTALAARKVQSEGFPF